MLDVLRNFLNFSILFLTTNQILFCRSSVSARFISNERQTNDYGNIYETHSIYNHRAHDDEWFINFAFFIRCRRRSCLALHKSNSNWSLMEFREFVRCFFALKSGGNPQTDWCDLCAQTVPRGDDCNALIIRANFVKSILVGKSTMVLFSDLSLTFLAENCVVVQCVMGTKKRNVS